MNDKIIENLNSIEHWIKRNTHNGVTDLPTFLIKNLISDLKNNLKTYAEWEDGFCTNCGGEIPYVWNCIHERYIHHETDFCQNCGSIMMKNRKD